MDPYLAKKGDFPRISVGSKGLNELAKGSFHVKSSGDFHGPPPILLKFGTLVGIV